MRLVVMDGPIVIKMMTDANSWPAASQVLGVERMGMKLPYTRRDNERRIIASVEWERVIPLTSVERKLVTACVAGEVASD